MVNTTTYVTAFIDLPQLEKNKKRRSYETYERVAENLLSLDINLVFFGDTRMRSHVNKIRTEKGLIDKTCIIPLSYEELPYYRYITQITKIIETTGIFGTTTCQRYTPSYIITILSKLPLLYRIACENPFNTSHFCWIDFGYFHLKEQYPHMFKINISEILAEVDLLWGDTFKIQMIRPPEESTINMNIQQLFSTDRNTLAGGIFGGSRAILEWITEQQESTVIDALGNNCIANEEMVLTSILYKNPQRFDLNGAYYASVLQNFAAMRMNLEKVIPVLNFADRMEWNTIAISICRRILAGNQHKYVTLSTEMLNLVYSIYLKYCSHDKFYYIKLASENGGSRWKYQHNMDSLYGDIARVEHPFTLPELIEKAEKTPGCIAFTTTGWLKRTITLSSCTGYASGEGIYTFEVCGK